MSGAGLGCLAGRRRWADRSASSYRPAPHEGRAPAATRPPQRIGRCLREPRALTEPGRAVWRPPRPVSGQHSQRDKSQGLGRSRSAPWPSEVVQTAGQPFVWGTARRFCAAKLGCLLVPQQHGNSQEFGGQVCRNGIRPLERDRPIQSPYSLDGYAMHPREVFEPIGREFPAQAHSLSGLDETQPVIGRGPALDRQGLAVPLCTS